jgi:hypothetical protein
MRQYRDNTAVQGLNEYMTRYRIQFRTSKAQNIFVKLNYL